MSDEGTSPPLGARSVTVAIAVEMVHVEHGVWCDACALSCAVRATFATTYGNRTNLQTRAFCNGDHS